MESDLKWGASEPRGAPTRDPWIDPISTPEHWLTWLKGRLEIDPPLLLGSDIINNNVSGASFGEGIKGSIEDISDAANPFLLTLDVGADLSGTDHDVHGFWSAGDPTKLTIPANLDGFYELDILLNIVAPE